ncbi:folate-binding protein [Hydrogenophaga sp.]|uniref:CAF17-like 4Fe-4S cluster assembly/insertion protein YgfZ n=1 Tax=Hydrogenophaga sp. TaxID=1904254 RepID=UPI0019A0871D|nr:folate-binding protein [Hydrogenophaga sp.]MBD3892825.1 folate-binding protein [Hydrogenophaga sp.]
MHLPVSPDLDPARLSGVTPLPQWGVLRAQGSDAATFLHGQLTQDFALLDLSQARLAALCSPKGRMLASFIGCKLSQDDILLICSRDLLAATLKRLSMFVLRAQVKLSDASAAFALWGVVGHSTAPLPEQPWSKLSPDDGSHWLRLPPALGLGRALWLAPLTGASAAQPAGPLLEPALWPWLEVMSGVALLSAPVQDAFVPQMLNYESVGGVSFKKGCYPGQEVVARSQFRGTLKRRAFLAHSSAELVVGQAVFHEGDAEQPCGTLAAAAACPTGGWNAIVSMQISAAAAGRLHAGSADGAELQLLALPYPLLDDV